MNPCSSRREREGTAAVRAKLVGRSTRGAAEPQCQRKEKEQSLVSEQGNNVS